MKLFRNRDIGLGGDVIYNFSSFSHGGHFVQRSGAILANLVEVHPMKLFSKRSISLVGDDIKCFFFLFSFKHFW